MPSHPKPEKPAPAPRRRIAARCACGHRKSKHDPVGDYACVEPGCLCAWYRLPTAIQKQQARAARSSVLREKQDMSSIRGAWEVGKRPARKSAPARTKRKLMPKCKHCAHPHGRHAGFHVGSGCLRCQSCPGYEPAIGIRQKRRTPEAAVKRIADDLWTRIIHARPEVCEVQQYHAHTCAGGYQAMHGIPRTFAATRWLPINGFKGCAGTHKFHTDRPEAWSALLLEAWGLEAFRELWRKARALEPVDMDATVAGLRAELAMLES